MLKNAALQLSFLVEFFDSCYCIYCGHRMRAKTLRKQVEFCLRLKGPGRISCASLERGRSHERCA